MNDKILTLLEEIRVALEAQDEFNKQVLDFMRTADQNMELVDRTVGSLLKGGTDTIKALMNLGEIIAELEQDVAIRKTIVAEPVNWVN